jgi:hypothetical protein
MGADDNAVAGIAVDGADEIDFVAMGALKHRAEN